MTTDQKLAHIRWYIAQAEATNNKDGKLHWISMGEGAAGAWFADMTISHEDYKELIQTFKTLIKEVLGD